jgi:hypothetical protein
LGRLPIDRIGPLGKRAEILQTGREGLPHQLVIHLFLLPSHGSTLSEIQGIWVIRELFVPAFPNLKQS